MVNSLMMLYVRYVFWNPISLWYDLGCPKNPLHKAAKTWCCHTHPLKKPRAAGFHWDSRLRLRSALHSVSGPSSLRCQSGVDLAMAVWFVGSSCGWGLRAYNQRMGGEFFLICCTQVQQSKRIGFISCVPMPRGSAIAPTQLAKENISA